MKNNFPFNRFGNFSPNSFLKGLGFKVVMLMAVIGFNISFPNQITKQIDELEKLSLLLEKQFWKIKQQNLKKREAYDDKLSDLDELIKTGYLKKNNLTEELYLVKENLANLQEQLKTLTGEQSEFKSSVSDRIDGEAKKLNFGYPYLLNKKLPEVNSLQKDINAYPLDQVIVNLINYKKSIIQESESVVIGSDVYIHERTSERFTAPYVRAGFIHQSYSSPDQSAIVLRESSLKGVQYNWENQLTQDLKAKLDKSLDNLINAKKSQKLVDISIDPAQSGKKLQSFLRNDLSGFGHRFLKFFIDGGVIMYPMSFLLILGIITFGERIWFYRKNSLKNLSYVDQAFKYLKSDNKAKAVDIFKDNPGEMQRILSSIISKSEKFSRDDAERIIDEKIFKEIPAFDKRLPTLAVIAAVAPLLGLLGTVSGMIQLFDVITAYGTADPKLLAGGISIALVTTQAGLGLAIPFMLCHHVLSRQKNTIVNHLEQTGILALEVLYPDDSQANGEENKNNQNSDAVGDGGGAKPENNSKTD